MDDVDPPPLLPQLDALLRDRLSRRPEGSYSVSLLTDRTLAQRKLMEEAFEVCLELRATDDLDRPALAGEAADLVFHLLAALVGAGVSWTDVEDALRARHGRPARDSTYGDGPDGTVEDAGTS